MEGEESENGKPDPNKKFLNFVDLNWCFQYTWALGKGCGSSLWLFL